MTNTQASLLGGLIGLLIIALLGLVILVLDSRSRRRQEEALVATLRRAKALGQDWRREVLERPTPGTAPERRVARDRSDEEA